MAGVAGTESSTLALPVLGKFWFEDGVWNGVAEDMAVAVFGKTLEDAMANLKEAVESHLEVISEAGELPTLISHLQERNREYGREPFGVHAVKMLVTVRNGEVVAKA